RLMHSDSRTRSASALGSPASSGPPPSLASPPSAQERATRSTHPSIKHAFRRHSLAPRTPLGRPAPRLHSQMHSFRRGSPLLDLVLPDGLLNTALSCGAPTRRRHHLHRFAHQL